jgi:CO/xanthine dehydrogenase FAD-binding subunit
MGLIEVIQPKNLEEVIKYLSVLENVKLLAGGTDLVLDLKRDKLTAKYLINLGKVNELKNIRELEKDIIIGSMATFSEIKENYLINKYFNSLILCADNMGSPQIRNLATIGGNIVNAGAAADMVPVLMSLEARFSIESHRGKRQVSCNDYFKYYDNEKVNYDEVLIDITIPKCKIVSGFYKLGKRNALAISRLTAAVSIEIENDLVGKFAVALGAVGRHAFRISDVEAIVQNKEVEYLFHPEVLKLLEGAVYTSIKGRKTMPFKKEVVKGVYKEALRIALGQEMVQEGIHE